MKKCMFAILISAFSISLVFMHLYKRAIKRGNDENRKKQEFYDVFYKWLKIHIKGNNLSDYFVEHGFSKVAIYGMKEMGELLYDELKENEEIEVVCAIDRNTNIDYREINVLSPDDDLPNVDVIVVTAIHYYNEIEDIMKEKVMCPVISIEDVVYAN